MNVAVALVDAHAAGNVGTVARAMKNFGFDELLLVDPPEITPGDEAYGFAGHAREDILPNATELSFESLVTNYHTVGFTAHVNRTGAKHIRYPFLTPNELVDDLAGVDADTALVFGREDKGLSNDELEDIDQICSIPAADDYPVLNLGQAATITLYELRTLTDTDTQLPDRTDRAPQPDIERFHDGVETLLDALEYKPEKRAKTMRLVRRLVGRSHPTGRELTTLRGVVRQAREAAENED